MKFLMFPLWQHLAKGTPDLLPQGSAGCLRPDLSRKTQILQQLVHTRPDLTLFSALGLGP